MSLRFACIWLHMEALEQAFKSKNINWGGYFLDQAPTWTVLISFWVPLPTTYLCLWHIVHGKYIWYVWFTVIESRAKVITIIPVVIQSPCCFPTSLLGFYMVYPFSFPWASPPVPWDSLSLVLTLLSPGSVFYHCPLRVRSIPPTQLTQAIKQRSNGNNFSSLLTPTTSQTVILWCFRTYYWHPEICSLVETVVCMTVKVISFSPRLYTPQFL